MAYHFSVFGEFADGLRQYADLDGYIPEPGDPPDAFRYPAGWEFVDDEEWADWVYQATQAGDEAKRAVAHWRDR